MFRRPRRATTGPVTILPAPIRVLGIPAPIRDPGIAAAPIRDRGTRGQTPVPGIQVDRIVARGTAVVPIRVPGIKAVPIREVGKCRERELKSPLFFCSL